MESETPKGPITTRIERPKVESADELRERMKSTPPTPADIVAGRTAGRPGVALPVEHKEEEKS